MAVERRRYLYVPPVDPGADPTCRLERPDAEQRLQTMDMLIQRASNVEPLPTGMELRLLDSTEEREKLEQFIEEEAACCPWLAFEIWIEGSEAVLRIVHPAAEEASV